MTFQNTEKERYRTRIFSLAKSDSDKRMNFFLSGFFALGLILAFFYNTWLIAIGIGGLSLLAYHSAGKIWRGSDLYQYVLAAVLGIFTCQYLYQMHGMYEMNLFMLISSALLVMYQNWKLQLPLILVVVLHHAVFAYLQHNGSSDVYFTQFENLSLQAFIFRVAFLTLVFFNCGFWAYQFKKYTERNIDQCYEIVRLGEEQLQKEELLKMSEKIIALNSSLEKKVEERTSELAAANKELESFSYSVSHDLRAPLRIINGFAKLLARKYGDKLDEEAKENIEIIVTNARRMGNLIDDLLNFSRLGRAELQKNRLDMNRLVRSVIDDVKSMDNNNAEVHLHDLKAASADPSLIKQVWVNLLTNATKYSRNKEKPVIEIGTIGENGHLTYYVKDNGAGFDMQHYDKLFGVFQRLHKVTEYEGTGVGLALTQRIINRHGGKIWAEAKVNEGATFYFTLPAKDDTVKHS